MEDTIFETSKWSVSVRRVTFLIHDPRDPAQKEEFSLRVVGLPHPVEEFINEMEAAYLEELREDIGDKFPYHYHDVRRNLQLRAWLRGQQDQRSKMSQPPFYVPFREYSRELLSRITGQEYQPGAKRAPLSVEELEQLASGFTSTFEEEEKLRLARWGFRHVPRFSKDEDKKLRRALRKFWDTFDEIMRGYGPREPDMRPTDERMQDLWRSSRATFVRDETGQEIPVAKFVLDGMNDQKLEFLDFACRCLFDLLRPELSRVEQRWFLFEHTSQRQFYYLIPAVSRAIYNLFSLSQEARYFAMLVYGFRVKQWRGHDLEARFRELWNVYLTLYALQRSETGTFLEREEEKAMKRKTEARKEVLFGNEDDLLRLGYQSSALEIEDIVLRSLEEEEIERLITTELTPREAELTRLRLQEYNFTDAASEMGISPQRTRELGTQVQRKLEEILIARRDDYPSISEGVNRE